MSKKDEAMKLALEALKQIDEAMPFPVAKLAQAALREALAEQPAIKQDLTPEQPAQQEPVVECDCETATSPDGSRLTKCGSDQMRRAVEQGHAFRKQPSQPQQEPVAWRTKNATPPGGYVVFQQYPQALANLGVEIEPLYTSPPAAQQELVEMSPEFTDTARSALLWVLWHHQGGRSPVGQPIRFALGMSANERLNDWQISEAKRWAKQTNSTTAEFHQSASSPPAQRTWVGLTDVEIASACKKHGGAEWWWRDIEEYGRAIEAKLKEKNT